MNISVRRGGASGAATPLLVIPVFEGHAPDAALGAEAAAAHSRGAFTGKDGESVLLFPASGPERLLLAGLGKADAVTAEKLRRLGGTAAKQAAKARSAEATIALPATPLAAYDAARALAEGVTLGAYTFTELKARPEDQPAPVELVTVTLLLPEGADEGAAAEGARVGGIAARGENLARTLGNLPGNIATPTYLAGVAERIGEEHGMKVTILGPAEMEEEGMGALLAVARGTDEEPRFIVLEHRGGAEGDRPVVLVGKGLTFDAGGISIKPAAGMEEMKFDMCGGAGVLGAMQAIGELKVRANVIGIVPSSENLLGGRAMKPGDVFRAHSGKTIEVVNTDAEGRLILADALSYAKRFDPVAVLDAATLTGACVIALGHQATGLMGNDEALLAEVRAAGDRTGERCWELPMFEEYREQIRSDYADIKNTGGRPAGAITAGWFLREFVSFPWCHLDVAGTAWGDGKLSYQVKGATGVPARLFVDWVLARAG
jgi:leucyl aminopeptidase